MAAHKKNKKKRVSSPRRSVVIFGYTFSRTLVTITGVFVLALLLSTQITTTQLLSSASDAQNVLGESEENSETGKRQEEQRKEEVKKAEERQKEERKTEGQMNRPKIKTENTSSNGVRTKTKSDEDKQETRVETPDGLRIKTKTEVGKTEIEVKNDSRKMEYRVENGKVVVKSDEESEQNEEAEDETDEETDITSRKSARPVFVNNNIGATTDFPVSIDTATNKLIISTPEGDKTVTILPDQAVTNLLSTGIVNTIDTSTATTDETEQLEGTVKIIVKNNEAVYEVNGKKIHKVFGFIPVSTSKKVIVSAETGDSISQEQSIFANIVERLSP